MAKSTRIRVSSTARRSGKSIVVNTRTTVNGKTKSKTTVLRPK